MASTSAPSRPTVVLPSIHEMFPEHLIPVARSAPRALPAPFPSPNFPRSHYVPQPPPSRPDPAFSFDVLKSDPHGSSLEHIASSRPSPPALSKKRRPNSRAGSSSGSSDGDAEMEEEEDGDDGAGADEGKKHVCPTCGKRFNRPSSLRIHRNTHTGATPFRCPYPSCGRAFNVNSNMRRHFRNHASSAFVAPNSSASSPISPTSNSLTSPMSFSSHGSYPSSPSSYSASPTSPPSASWSDSSSTSHFSPPTPLSPLPSHPGQAYPWTLPKSYRVVPGAHRQSYSESDVRSERR